MDVPQLDPYDPISVADPDYDGPTIEDFQPSPPKPRSPLSRFPETSAARPAVLCFILFWAASLHDWGNRGDGLWVSGETVLKDHQYWRLLTALFDHADISHLLANAPLFLIFGWFLRAFFGPLAFPFGALLVGALSNLWTIYIYDPRAELLGASGMLYGMVALWLVLYVRFETVYKVGMRIFRAIGVSLLLLFPTTFERTTSYTAHGTGFLLGTLVGLLLCPLVTVQRGEPEPVIPVNVH